MTEYQHFDEHGSYICSEIGYKGFKAYITPLDEGVSMEMGGEGEIYSDSETAKLIFIDWVNTKLTKGC